MGNTDIRVGLVQQANGPSMDANVEKLRANIKVCAAEGAQLVILQELHNSLYFCQTEDTANFDLAEPIPGSFYTHVFPTGSRSGNCFGCISF